MTEPDLSRQYRVHDDEVSAKIYDNEVIIINLTSGFYYASQGLGAWIWSALNAGQTPRAIAEQVASAFEIDKTAATADVARFLGALIDAGLMAQRPNRHADDPAQPEIALPIENAYRAARLDSYDDLAEILSVDPPMPLVNPDQ